MSVADLLSTAEIAELWASLDEVRAEYVAGAAETAKLGALEKAILFLANQCDGAETKDGIGFNKHDAEFGRALAQSITSGKELSTAICSNALKMLKKYARQLFLVGIDIGEVETEVKNRTKGEEGDTEKAAQADILTELAKERAILFHDNLGDPFALVKQNEHSETLPLKSQGFRRWLAYIYREATDGKTARSETIGQAICALEGISLWDGEEHNLSLRVARSGEAIWYDMADPGWRAIKITAEDYQTVDNPPILFRRYGNTAAQVEPKAGGDILDVLRFVNLKTADHKLLFLVDLVTSLVPEIPHPIADVSGEKGAAKSTLLRVKRRLVDPGRLELFIMSNDKSELALQLAHNYVPCYDNLDGLQQWQSDMLCCASTGAGVPKRELYTNQDEIILTFKHCPAINGINEAAKKEDLLDRILKFEVERIEEENRKPESDFWADFEKARPSILGGMFDALAGAIRIYPTVKLNRLPRMADFCKWGYAVAEALGEKGYVIAAGDSGDKHGKSVIKVNGESFLGAYTANRGEANESAILNNPVAAAIMALLAGRPQGWTGTAGELLDSVNNVAQTEKIDTTARTWPKAANSLTRRLKPIKSNLADVGISLTITRDTDKNVSVVTLTPKGTKKTSGISGISGISGTQAGQTPRPGDTSGDIPAPGDNTSGGNDTSGIPPGAKPYNGWHSGGSEIPEINSEPPGGSPPDDGFAAFSQAVDEVAATQTTMTEVDIDDPYAPF